MRGCCNNRIAWRMKNKLQAYLWDNPPMLDSMVLYFKNNILPRPQWEDSETQLNDYSNNNNGGQIYSGGALSFTTNDLTESVDLGSVRSYSVWLSPDTTSEEILKLNASDSLSVVSGTVTLAGQSGTIYVDGVAGSTIPAGSYSHVTVVLDAGVDADAMQFGTDDGVAFGDLDISEAIFYSSELTAANVLANYNNPQEPITDGLVAWYDFNELNGATLFDRSGNGNNAAINGATWVSGVKEGYQPALAGFNNYQVLDGVDDYVSLTSNVFNGLSSFTIKGKFTATNSGVNTIIDERDGSSSDGVLVYYFEPNEILALRINNTVIAANQTIKLGEVCEFVIDWDGSQATFTINGTPEAPQAISQTISTTQVAAIGRTNYVSANYTQGIIDYVEVEGVGRWSNLGNWVDEIGSNDGTVNGSPVTARIAGAEYNSTTDVFGNTIQNAYIANALNFSGGYSGLYVDAGANVDTSGAFSYVGWAYLDSNSNNKRIFSNRNGGDGLTLSLINSPPRLQLTSESGGTPTTITSGSYSANARKLIGVTKSADGSDCNFYMGDKNNVPVLLGIANQDAGTPAGGSENMTFAADPDGGDNLNGYLFYEVMYDEDLSSANTNLKLIIDAWNATRGSIPT